MEVTLTEKYKDHIKKFANHFIGFYFDGFTARYELDMGDAVGAHWYDRRPTPGIDYAFINTMQDLGRDYLHHRCCAEDWMYKTFSTGAFAYLLEQFNMAIQANEEGRADDLHRRRFFFYSGHDTAIQMYACAL